MKCQWVLRFILRATWMSVTNGNAWCLRPWRRHSGERILALFNHSASIIKASWSLNLTNFLIYLAFLNCLTQCLSALYYMKQPVIYFPFPAFVIVLMLCWMYMFFCFFLCYISQCMFNIKCLTWHNIQMQFRLYVHWHRASTCLSWWCRAQKFVPWTSVGSEPRNCHRVRGIPRQINKITTTGKTKQLFTCKSAS